MLSQSTACFIGIDLGTSGLRLVGVDQTGQLCASAAESWPIEGTTQDPNRWIAALKRLWNLCPEFSGARAISVCSTSGTVLAVDKHRKAHTAWLYSDRSGAEESAALGIPVSWGLGRWLWWLAQFPNEAATTRLAHPADFVLSALGAPSGITDHTTALKSGYDPEQGNWQPALSRGVPAGQLPEVVRPGTRIGRLAPDWGGSDVLLVAGCTDGIAGQIASGALLSGQLCTSLGSTLIFKGVSTRRIESSDRSVYSHLHPDGNGWLPGAASNCGGAVLGQYFDRKQWDHLSALAAALVPTGSLAYPLSRPGERFPLVNPDFPGILPPGPRDTPNFWAGLLEGIALVERLGIERLAALEIPVEGELITVGGAARSLLWLRIRATVLNRPLHLPALNEPAMGAAILAAAGYWQVSVSEAARTLVRLDRIVEPVPAWVDVYQMVYGRFKEILRAQNPGLL